MGKIPIVWQLFLTEMNENYVPVLTESVLTWSEKRQREQGTSQAEAGVFRAFSQVVHLFVSFLGGLIILNENATTLLDLTFKTCTETLESLLALALGLNPAQLMIDSDIPSLLQRRQRGLPNDR